MPDATNPYSMQRLIEARRRAAMRRASPWCVCMSRPDAPSTHRAPAHFTACTHSTLRETTRAHVAPTFRRIAGTRAITGRLD